MKQIASPAVIDYYEALEILLRNARRVGEYRTHFGLLNKPRETHCFIRNVALPQLEENRLQRQEMQVAMDALQEKIFNPAIKGAGKNVADIGCGTGGTLKYLSQHYPYHNYWGVNINAVQFHLALNHLADQPHVRLSNQNFFHFEPETAFDLMYFIESAFHMGPKEALCKKISDNLSDGGEVILVDIFQEEELYRRIKGTREKELFSYLSVNRWKQLFRPHGLECTGYEDLSHPIANYCAVTTPREEFLHQIVPQLVGPDQMLGRETLDNFMKVYQGYKRLSRQLKRGSLQYGILRFKKVRP